MKAVCRQDGTRSTHEPRRGIDDQSSIQMSVAQPAAMNLRLFTERRAMPLRFTLAALFPPLAPRRPMTTRGGRAPHSLRRSGSCRAGARGCLGGNLNRGAVRGQNRAPARRASPHRPACAPPRPWQASTPRCGPSRPRQTARAARAPRPRQARTQRRGRTPPGAAAQKRGPALEDARGLGRVRPLDVPWHVLERQLGIGHVKRGVSKPPERPAVVDMERCVRDAPVMLTRLGYYLGYKVDSVVFLDPAGDVLAGAPHAAGQVKDDVRGASSDPSKCISPELANCAGSYPSQIACTAFSTLPPAASSQCSRVQSGSGTAFPRRMRPSTLDASPILGRPPPPPI